MPSKPVILIADEDPVVLDELATRLTDCGLRVLKATNSRSLVRTLRQEQVDVAIVDTSLDDVEGHKLLGVIRELDPRLDVIVTTSEHSPELENEVRRREVLYYAIRPDEDAFLDEVVRSVLLRRQGRAALAGLEH